jgi:hypothetical protein
MLGPLHALSHRRKAARKGPGSEAITEIGRAPPPYGLSRETLASSVGVWIESASPLAFTKSVLVLVRVSAVELGALQGQGRS